MLFLLFPLFIAPFHTSAIAGNDPTLFKLANYVEASSLLPIICSGPPFGLDIGGLNIWGYNIPIQLFIVIYYCFFFLIQLVIYWVFFRKSINDYLDYILGNFSGTWKLYTGDGKFGYRVESCVNGKLISTAIIDNEKDVTW
jgi:hypothetical protein